MKPINVIDALSNMKTNKSSDESGISAEHLHYAPLDFLVRVTDLFNGMLRYSLIPLVKDPRGNLADNYKGQLQGHHYLANTVQTL